MGDHWAQKNRFIELLEVFPHGFTILLAAGFQIVTPMVLWLGAQELSNELLLNLLEAGDRPHAQPPKPCLGGPKKSQGKCVTQGSSHQPYR